MPERVVDRLEAVEVDEHHRGLLAIALAERERLAQPVLQQPTVGKTGERIVVGEVLRVRLGFLQLGGALGDGALERMARSFQRFAGVVLGGDVVVAPDPLLRLVAGVDAPAARAAAEGRAVAALEAPLGVVRAAGRGGEIGERTGALPVVAIGEQDLRVLADELAGARADHLLEVAVAALNGAVPDEGDADSGVIEDQLLLGERALDALLGFVLARDVLEEPHRALRGIARLQRAAADRAPDKAAVLAHVLAAQLLRLAAPDRLVHRRAAGVVFGVAAEHEARRLLEELDRLLAENFLEPAVAAHDAPLLHEDDAGERVFEHRVLFAQQPMQRLVGALPFGDVLAQPDVALRRLARRDRPAGDAAPEARAVLAAHPGLARVHLAAIELGVGLGHLLVFRVGEIDVARRRADRAARRVSEHLLEAAVTAHRAAIARELDADPHRVAGRLVLGAHPLQLLLGLALFGDVFDDPDGAFMRLARIDRAAIGPVPEGAAVLRSEERRVGKECRSRWGAE